MVTFYDGTNYALSELDAAQYGWVSLERVFVKMGNIHAWTGVLSQQNCAIFLKEKNGNKKSSMVQIFFLLCFQAPVSFVSARCAENTHFTCRQEQALCLFRSEFRTTCAFLLLLSLILNVLSNSMDTIHPIKQELPDSAPLSPTKG